MTYVTLLHTQEVVGSNPTVPTIFSFIKYSHQGFSFTV